MASVKKSTGAAEIKAEKVIPEEMQAGEKRIPTTINLQAYGKSISGEELVEMARQAWSDTGHDLAAIETLDIYIKTEDSRVYYVVNKIDTGTFFLYG